MHNKSLKNGSERFWPTPLSQDAKQTGLAPSGTGQAMKLSFAVQDYTQTSSPSTEPTTPGLICSQGDFLASLSVSPGSAEARKMTERSGRKCCELLGKPSPLGSLVKTLLESSRWNSTISYLTWKASATPRGRLLFRLVPSMPDTDGTEFGLWPTPQASDTSARKKSENWKGDDLPSTVNALGPESNHGSLNPAWVEWLMGYPIGHTACEGWETPSSRKLRLKSSAPSST